MGLFASPEKCFFTGLPTTDHPGDIASIDYSIEIKNHRIFFRLSDEPNTNMLALIKKNTTIIRGEIFNNKWPTKGLSIDQKEIEKLIQTSSAPKNPKEKLDNLFLEIFKLQKSEGDQFEIKEYLFDPIFWGKLYFNDENECNFYLRTLDDYGLIKGQKNHNGAVIAASITFKGLNYRIELNETGIQSENCFIAMSFGDGTKPIRDAIKLAISETGFKPLLIDELHIDADKTINDEIIATIKKSRFSVCDFTEQKDGVYFEAGYALGLGLKVIYTCHEDWFKHSHFDTNHFPHIIYKDPTDLLEKLKLKIEAWIK